VDAGGGGGWGGGGGVEGGGGGGGGWGGGGGGGGGREGKEKLNWRATVGDNTLDNKPLEDVDDDDDVDGTYRSRYEPTKSNRPILNRQTT